MFSRFASALYSAVDALAPPLPLQEDFVWHWKSVTKYYTSQHASKKQSIEMTTIPGHLLEMLSILEQEEKELEEGSIGACMEYIMNRKVLDTMCVLGIADSPPGMKRYMLIFVTRFLKIVQEFLIPHVSIYIPIAKFMKLCGEVLAGPTEREEMDLLEAVCERLVKNPYLVNCFMVSKDDKHTPNGEIAQGQPSRKLSSDHSGAKFRDDAEVHTLISVLLKLFVSPDKNISERASTCLKNCCSIANDTAAFTVVEHTKLSSILCDNLVKLYATIPKRMKLCEIEGSGDVLAKEGGLSKSKISSSRRKFLCYMQHVSLIDTIVQDSHPVIADSIASGFRVEFLNTVIYADMVESQDADVNLFVTTIASASIRSISSQKLMLSFEVFMLGDLQNFDISGHASHVVKDVLIDRCRDSDGHLALSMASLQLFEEILHRPSQFVLQNLVINSVESRGYFDDTAADDWFSFSDDDSSKLCGDDDSLLSSSPVNHTFAPPYIHRILDAFLSLVPDDLKSAETEEDAGYDTYIKETHCKFMKCLSQCEGFDWPAEPLSKEDYHMGADDNSSSGSQPEADSYRKFHEGPFLSMLFDKIEHMLELPYDINLQVTAIVSTLALFAHPNLHEYLLNPLIPLAPGVRSLFSALLKTVETIQDEIKNIKSFQQKLRLTRKALLGDDPYEAFEDSNIFEVLIVIEEFCKELAAIAFVKYNAVSQ